MDETVKQWNRWDWVALGGAVLVAAATWAPRLSGPLDLRYDAGVYYLLGQSLAEGRGYRLLNEPGTPSANQYPPGLPVMAAVAIKLAGTSDFVSAGEVLRWMFCLVSMGFAAVVYALLRRWLPLVYALPAGVIAVLSLQTFYLSNMFSAEIPFALVTCAALLIRGGTWRTEIGRGLLVGLTFLLRTAGLALMAGWVGEALLRRQWKSAALRAAWVAVPFLAWNGWVKSVEWSDEYQRPAYAYQRAPYQFYNVSYATNVKLIDPFNPVMGELTPGMLVQRAVTNLGTSPLWVGEGASVPVDTSKGMIGRINLRLFGGRAVVPEILSPAFTVVLGCLVLIGVGLLLWRGEYLLPLYLLASVGLIALTPWPHQFRRYTAPLTPVMLLAGGYALCVLQARLRERRLLPMAIIGIVAGVVLMMQAYALYFTFKAGRATVNFVDRTGGTHPTMLMYYDVRWEAFDDAVRWLAGRAKADEVTATIAPHWYHLQSGKQAVMPPMHGDEAEVWRLMDSVPVKYYIVELLEFAGQGNGFRHAEPFVRDTPSVWRKIYTDPRGLAWVYERVDAPATQASP
jgi:hypothetical protein